MPVVSITMSPDSTVVDCVEVIGYCEAEQCWICKNSWGVGWGWWDGNAWSGEEDLGGIVTSGVGVSSLAQAQLDCFVEGTDSAMWHKWFA